MSKLKDQLAVLPQNILGPIEVQLTRIRPDQEQMLFTAFNWELSPQGPEYWTLVNELINYFENPEFYNAE